MLKCTSTTYTSLHFLYEGLFCRFKLWIVSW